MDIKHICRLIDENKEELFGLLGSLIKINSENFITYGNEREIAEYINKLCIDLGLETELYSPMDVPGFKEHPDYIDGHHLEDRLNVTARFRGEENIDGLMIMGHLDTMPIGDLRYWDFEPLSGEIRDGCIWGRGACDDKYALATALFIIRLLKSEGFVPKKNLLFGAYSDEENGGSHGALATVLKYPCERIVNMDGRQNEIWNCASGGQEAKYFFHTKDAANSAVYAARGIPVVLDVLEGFRQTREAELEKNPYYRDTIIPKTSLRYMGVKAGNAGSDLGRGEAHFTYYTEKTKDEIYREFAELEGVLNEKLEPLGLVGEHFTPFTRFFHYTAIDPKDKSVTDFIEASNEAIGVSPRVSGSCLSDLSVIGKYGGGAAFAYGGGRDFSLPGGAHNPNEFIECDALVRFAKVIAAYVVKTLG